MLRKSFDGTQEHIEPAETDLDLIRTLALRDVKPEEIWAGRMHLANDQIDRAHERFPKEYLERFAETLPGKSLMGGHNYDTLPLGRFYKASVQKNDTGYYLDANYYVAADSPLVTPIELGVVRESSIGYNSGKRVCEVDQKEWIGYWGQDDPDYCHHTPGQTVDGKRVTLLYCPTEAHKAEALEGSWVWKGCQDGAMAIAKSAAGPGAVEYEHIFRMMARLYQPGTGAPKPMPTLEEVQKELLETKRLHTTRESEWQKAEATLKAQAADGEWGRTYLSGEIVRMAGLVGKTDSYSTILKHLGETPTVAQLLPIYEELGKEFDARYPQARALTLGAPDPKDSQAPTVAVPWFRQRTA